MNARAAISDSPTPARASAAAVSTATGDAVLFPGQGSQTSSMRALTAEHRPDLLRAARRECGADPFERIEQGTAYAQPAMYAASLAAWERCGRPAAAALAGHSLGELAALAAAGAIEPHEGLRIAARRGRLMQEAAERSQPGGMLALLGDEDETKRIAAELGLTIANHNAIGQFVLSGPLDQLEAARRAARERKLKAMKLPIAGAFHSPAMRDAVAPFRRALDDVEFAAPAVPVYSSTTAAPFDDVRGTLADALVRPVRWTQTLTALHEAGVERFLEPGPGKVLTGLVKRTLPDAEAVALETVALETADG